MLHATEDVDQDRLLKGVDSVYAKLLDALRRRVEQVDAEGQPFDPRSCSKALMRTWEATVSRVWPRSSGPLYASAAG